jgi:hypothetical protein
MEKPNDNIPEEPNNGPEETNITRRDFLRKTIRAGVGVASLGVFGGGLGKTYVEVASERRSAALLETTSFLRGQSGESILIFGKEFNYEEFCGLVLRLANPPIESRQTLSELLDSFCYMMEVEDKFEGSLNVLPVLEHMEFIREEYFSSLLEAIGLNKDTLLLADTFGEGQINFQIAHDVATDHAEKLASEGLIPKEELSRISDSSSKKEIVEVLELQKGGNLIFSFLNFYEGYNLYARPTGGKVHGELQLPERRGQLQSQRAVNPRSFGLAITAYSAGLESPMVAKAQTYYNEMVLTDPDFKQITGDKLIEVDGDMGPETLRALKQMSAYAGTPGSQELEIREDTLEEQRKLVLTIDRWLGHNRHVWRRSLLQFQEGEFVYGPNTAEALKEMVRHRYSLQIHTYLILKEFIGDNKGKELLLKYIKNRSGNFLELITNEAVFASYGGGRNHAEFLARLHGRMLTAINFDERFKGYVPTNFKRASKPGADPMNMASRVFLALELDPKSTSRIVSD